MSRSVKRVPGFSDNESSKVKKYWLRVMNKRIRKSDMFIPDGNSYRRFIERWNYRDYNWRVFTERQVQDTWYFREDKVYKMYMK